MINKIYTQKVYTFPERKLYGEFMVLQIVLMNMEF